MRANYIIANIQVLWIGGCDNSGDLVVASISKWNIAGK